MAENSIVDQLFNTVDNTFNAALDIFAEEREIDRIREVRKLEENQRIKDQKQLAGSIEPSGMSLPQRNLLGFSNQQIMLGLFALTVVAGLVILEG